VVVVKVWPLLDEAVSWPDAASALVFIAFSASEFML
jgi:hypothetical protein